MKNSFNFGKMDKNYATLVRALTGNSDITKYVFDGIEEELDKFINLLNDDEQAIINYSFGLKDKEGKNIYLVSKKFSKIDPKYTPSKINKIQKEALQKICMSALLSKKSNSYSAISFEYNEEILRTNLERSLESSKEHDKYSNFKSLRTKFLEDIKERLNKQETIIPTDEPIVSRSFRK